MKDIRVLWFLVAVCATISCFADGLPELMCKGTVRCVIGVCDNGQVNESYWDLDDAQGLAQRGWGRVSVSQSYYTITPGVNSDHCAGMPGCKCNSTMKIDRATGHYELEMVEFAGKDKFGDQCSVFRQIESGSCTVEERAKPKF